VRENGTGPSFWRQPESLPKEAPAYHEVGLKGLPQISGHRGKRFGSDGRLGMLDIGDWKLIPARSADPLPSRITLLARGTLAVSPNDEAER